MRRMTALHRVIAILAILVASLLSSPALAGDASTAEQLFQEGLEAMKRNEYPVACEAFAGSNRADASPGTQINLALCFEKQRKWASAWAWYRSAAGLAEQRGQAERASLANREAERIKPLLHFVVISVKPVPDGLVVKRDGEEITTVVGGREVSLPFDPGEHTIEVGAKGKKTVTKKLTTPDTAGTERLEIGPLEAGAEDKPGGGGPGPVGGGSDGTTQRMVGLIVGGAGILSAVGGVIMFVVAGNEVAKRNEENDEAAREGEANKPENMRPHTGSAKSHHDAAKNNELIGIGFLAGSAVMIGTGAVLFFTAPKGDSTRGKTRILPNVGPGYAGIGIGGTF